MSELPRISLGAPLGGALNEGGNIAPPPPLHGGAPSGHGDLGGQSNTQGSASIPDPQPLRSITITLSSTLGESKDYVFDLQGARGLQRQLAIAIDALQRAQAGSGAGSGAGPNAIPGENVELLAAPGGGAIPLLRCEPPAALGRPRVRLLKPIVSRGIPADELGEVLSVQHTAKMMTVWFPRYGTLSVRAALLEAVHPAARSIQQPAEVLCPNPVASTARSERFEQSEQPDDSGAPSLPS